MRTTTLDCFFSQKGSRSKRFKLSTGAPATVETRFNLVRAYFQAGKTAEALKTARELSAAHKQDVQLHFTLGVLLAEAKQYKAAQLELEQANALQPETFEILHNLGQTYLRATNTRKPK